MMDLLLVLAAAFGAGLLNAVAGGGSFLTLPALVAVGLPPVVANATGTLALLPGYFSGAWALRTDLHNEPGLPIKRLLVLCVTGGALGALLLIWMSPALFRHLAPWLLLAATAVFALAPRLIAASRRTQASPGQGARAQAALTAVSIYGGFFNGGIGIMLLALFSASGHRDLNTMNALKNLASGVLTAIAVLLYIAGGLIDWHHALIMVVAATLGGYVGGRLSRRVPGGVLRPFIVALGLAMSVLMFVAL